MSWALSTQSNRYAYWYFWRGFTQTPFMALKAAIQESLDSGVSEKSVDEVWQGVEARLRPMGDYRLSLKTLDDLDDIALYTLQEFGLQQSHRYRDGIKPAFKTSPTTRSRAPG